MRIISVLTLALLLLAAPGALAAQGVPKTLAGITLGESVDEYTKLCNMHMATPIPDLPFLSEAHIQSDTIPGVRGGSLTFANARDDRRLVRIKIKFHDQRQAFFKSLLQRYKATYGEPDSYRGDSFRNVIAWQWNFAANGERLSVILMWSRDPQLRPGVSIKMTLESLFKEEYMAFKKRHDRDDQGDMQPPTAVHDLDEFVPR